MAGDSEVNGNLKEHSASYLRFIWWLKVGTIGSVLVTALVIFLITR